MKKLIVTGDDFGLAEPVNEAIVEAHCKGILTTASLMVGAGWARDAAERAQRVPTLRVGLHLVLVEGRPVLPPGSIPGLVNGNGEFPSQLVRAGFNFFFTAGVRAQLEGEIRAQFEAFRKTGLALDHVNAHNHMHLHPTVLGLVLKVGGEYGMRAVRLPFEVPAAGNRARSIFLSPWIGLMRARLRRMTVRYNDFVLGMSASGSMVPEAVTKLIAQLPEGVTEMYFHPATRRCPEIDRFMPDYRHEEEFSALKDRSIREALDKAGVQRIAFSDL